MMKNISINFSKKKLLLLIFLILIIFLVIYIFRASFADVDISTNSIDYSKYRPSANFLSTNYSCNSTLYEFNHGSYDKQWIDIVVRINNSVTSGVNVFGEKFDSEYTGSGTICTGSGTSLQATDKSTGAWFRYMDSSGKFRATIRYKIPETDKVYSIVMNKSNVTNSVDNMVINSSSSTNVFCYKYGNTSSTETGTSCAKWNSNTVYAPKDASIGDFTWCSGLKKDEEKKCPVHQLLVDINPKFNVTYLDYNGNVLKDMTTYDYKTSLDSISKPSNPTRASSVSHDYTFSGWSTDVDNGGVNYLVDDIVYVATYTETLKKYSITFRDYDGKILAGPTSYDYGTTADKINVPTPSRSGYKFIGWDSSVSTVEGDKIYTAVYKKIYTVSFSDGFGNSLGDVSILDGGDATASITAPSRLGYKFSGWDKDISNIKSDMTVIATWTLENYSITYDYNDGTASGNPSSYTVESEDITLVNPTRVGYTFMGWTGTGLDSATIDVVIPKGSTSNRSYVANWKINSYNVILEIDVGIKSVSGDGTYEYGEEVTIDAEVMEGYDFAGWFQGNNPFTLDAKYTFKMGDHDVIYMASGTLKQFNIEIEKIKDGTAFFNDVSSFYYNKSHTVTFGEEVGYTIDTVVVDDEYIDFTSGSYNFENIKSNHKILISYATDANGDGIPDKYQKTITYKVVNGVFAKTLTNNDIVIKYNSGVYNSETGKWDDAQYKLNDVPEVIPNDGYLSGVWDVDINNDTIVKDDVVYTCTCVYDYKFTKQPTIKKQDAFGMFEIEWETNFTPVKIERYDKTDDRLIGVVDNPSTLTTTENLEEGERIDYYLRVYYDDNHYIDSDSIILKRYILLPATGDTGTIFYTIFGLLIIVDASIFFMTYRMNHSSNM